MAGPEPSEDTMIVSPDTLKRAYETGEFSDLTIHVDGEEFELHKLVVGGHSPILKEKIKNENSITLKPVEDLEYNGVYESMFRFMYGLDYNDNPRIDDIAFHFDVYRVARRYEVLGLQNLAFENIKKIANRDAWDADQLVKILKNRLDKDTLEEDDELFNFLIDTCHEHIDELVNNVDFEDVLEDDDTLAKYLILSWGDSQKNTYKWDNLSDITILVNGEEFKLHKVVIWEHSLQLKTLCEGKDKIEIEQLKNLDYVQRSYETVFQFMYQFMYGH
ncbi:hypothetical protein TCE0_017f03620 [Talaromyces pinophilus]|uniref:BTB domain-containing protein n=1 Tax=Talaromyces pinophilus TaxID=128442 RepID=A0A6V8H222_TALPI|nr:hypothetical protein TCE0_017f03620 [Talaromyces pinophilus]